MTCAALCYTATDNASERNNHFEGLETKNVTNPEEPQQQPARYATKAAAHAAKHSTSAKKPNTQTQKQKEIAAEEGWQRVEKKAHAPKSHPHQHTTKKEKPRLPQNGYVVRNGVTIISKNPQATAESNRMAAIRIERERLYKNSGYFWYLY